MIVSVQRSKDMKWLSDFDSSDKLITLAGLGVCFLLALLLIGGFTLEALKILYPTGISQ